MRVVLCIVHIQSTVMIRVKRLVEEICDKREFEHERNTMKMIECCVALGLCSLWMCTCAVHDKDVE